MNTKLTAKAYIQIQKSPETVFEAIVNPREMQNCFASGSDTLTSGQTVEWWLPEFPDCFPVSVKDVIRIRKSLLTGAEAKKVCW